MIDLDKLDKLPRRQSMRRSSMDYDYWDYSGPERYKGKGIYDLVFSCARRFVGQHVDLAFSYFCTKTKKKHQDTFLDYFETPAWVTNRNNWWYRLYVDEDGILCETTHKTKDVKFYTWDYEVARVCDNHKPKPWGDCPNCYWKIVAGSVYTFSSRNHYLYQKLRQEKEDLHKLWARNLKLEKDSKVYEFLTREEKRRKENKSDELKLQRYGMRDDAFRGREYHGKKRKWKKKE